MAQYERVFEAVRSVDVVNRRLSQGILGVMRPYLEKERLTIADAREIDRRIHRLIRPLYGSSGRQAERSVIFRTIAGVEQAASNEVAARVVRDIDRMIRDANPDGYARVRSAILAADDDFAAMYQSIYGPQGKRQRRLRARMLDPQRRWVDPRGYRLSDRVWRQGRDLRNRLNHTIRRGIRNGRSPLAIANDLEEYVNPDFAPVSFTRSGRVVRRGHRRHPSAASVTRRLARTEVAQVYHESTVQAVYQLGIDGAGVRWALSPSHPRIDVCDDLARGSSRGLPRGVYLPEEFPHIPHPHCLCSAEPYMPSREEVLRQIIDRYL